MIHEYSLSWKLSFNYARSLTLQIYDTCSSERSPCPLCLRRPTVEFATCLVQEPIIAHWRYNREYLQQPLPLAFIPTTDRPHDSPAVDRWSGIFIELITWPISPLIADDRAGWLVGWLTSYSVETERNEGITGSCLAECGWHISGAVCALSSFSSFPTLPIDRLRVVDFWWREREGKKCSDSLLVVLSGFFSVSQPPSYTKLWREDKEEARVQVTPFLSQLQLIVSPISYTSHQPTNQPQREQDNIIQFIPLGVLYMHHHLIEWLVLLREIEFSLWVFRAEEPEELQRGGTRYKRPWDTRWGEEKNQISIIITTI